MRKLNIGMTALLAIAAIGPAGAVHLDPGGQGQVLLFPYYTAHGHQQTLLSIFNSSDAAQVLQVTFREALNGRPVLQFKVWLGAADVWTGTVFALADDGRPGDGAAVLTRDRSCTTPMFTSSGLSTSGGTPYMLLGNASYSGPLSDGGPSDVGRARHGWVEVIALADVTGPLAASINFNSNGVPVSCAAVQVVPFGPNVATRPSGGLIGAAGVVRGEAGTLLASRAEALSGFTEISLFNDLTQPTPDLSAVNDGMPGAAASAMVMDDRGRRHALTYGAPGSGSRPIDAVSAVLMATHVKGEFQTSSSLGGATDWVVTSPTKPFYTDPAIIGASNPALAPFEELFAAPGNSKACAPYRLYSQEQKTWTPLSADCVYVPLSPFPTPVIIPSQFVTLFQAANVIPFYISNNVFTFDQSQVLAAPGPPRALQPFLPWHVPPYTGAAGWTDMNLATTQRNHRLPASAEGKVLLGLPAIGFAASNIINAAVSNGVLANYAYAVRHVTSVSCRDAADDSPCD